MIGGQVRSGGDPQAWNLELPGDPNFPGASGRAELEDKHKAHRQQLTDKHESAASVADDAKQTIAKLEKRKAAVADKKRYTDLPDELRQKQVDLVDHHIAKFAAVRSQSESLAMRNDPNEDVDKIRARSASKGAYDKLAPDQREIRKLTDGVALKEQEIATTSKRVEVANAVLTRMMPNDVRRGEGVKFSVFKKYNADAKQYRDMARAMEPKLIASAKTARDLRNQWSEAKDDPSRLSALRALDAELKNQVAIVEVELEQIRAATRSAYIVTSDYGIGKDWDYFKAIGCDGPERSLAINTAEGYGDVAEDEI
jgi:membrane-associated HD superfamily phosphohydrolase